MAKVRRVNAEGSAFGLRRAKGSVKSKEKLSTFEGKIGYRWAKGSVQSKDKNSEKRNLAFLKEQKISKNLRVYKQICMQNVRKINIQKLWIHFFLRNSQIAYILHTKFFGMFPYFHEFCRKNFTSK